MATISDSVRSLSISEISCPTPTTPTISPAAFLRVEELSSTITRSPSLVNKGNS